MVEYILGKDAILVRLQVEAHWLFIPQIFLSQNKNTLYSYSLCRHGIMVIISACQAEDASSILAADSK